MFNSWMPFLTLTNNQNIGNTDFYRDTSTSLKPTKDDSQGSGGFVNQSLLLLGEQLRNITLELHLPGISWFSGANARHAHLLSFATIRTGTRSQTEGV